ncbi:membrane or secreted protein [Rubripirellula amarantea]|uniref:Membrane or secreted protein n=1 Tax=Rubripirellula amarantea TaxID=2527999 RepID=A0A5C5WQM2_9BACT|nr:membrane or secreted protein [Rubripirellula amarantea]MDA8743650.1 membrane or secreted protein [Rubripirellula amarantea]TWT52401.1 hypothetical protein Pla22_00250 [Rubripirellula amarantea]
MRRDQQNILLLICFAAIATVSLGCRGQGVLPPAGPMLRQQSQAIINDPFPQNDIGPYEAASRPPDYQQPLPEAVRNRIHRDSTYGFGR